MMLFLQTSYKAHELLHRQHHMCGGVMVIQHGGCCAFVRLAQ